MFYVYQLAVWISNIDKRLTMGERKTEGWYQRKIQWESEGNFPDCHIPRKKKPDVKKRQQGWAPGRKKVGGEPFRAVLLWIERFRSALSVASWVTMKASPLLINIMRTYKDKQEGLPINCIQINYSTPLTERFQVPQSPPLHNTCYAYHSSFVISFKCQPSNLNNAKTLAPGV